MGMEETGGNKGYGLAMMIEILCGVMSGGTWGPNIRQWGKTDQPGNLSHCFIVLDPSVCGTGFQDRLQSMADMFRNLEPRDPCKPVLVPGDPERFKEKTVQASYSLIGLLDFLKTSMFLVQHVRNFHFKSLLK